MNNEDRVKAYLSRLYNDPVFFAREIFRIQRWDQVAPIGPVEEDIIRFDAFGPSEQVVLGFRQLGKTHLLSTCMTLWDTFRDPFHTTLIVSQSQGHAERTLNQIRQLIETIPFLRHMAPSGKGQGALDRTTEFNVAQVESAGSRTPTVTCVGVEGQLPGRRAATIRPDDTESKTNTRTAFSRQQLRDMVKEFRAIKYVNGGKIKYVGTPHHEDSLYFHLGSLNYVVRSWPLLYPQKNERVMNLAPFLAERLESGEAKPGDITVPHRFTTRDVDGYKSEGHSWFALQYMLQQNVADAFERPLRLSDLVVVDHVDIHEAPTNIVWGKTDHNGSTLIEDIRLCAYGEHVRFYAPAMVTKQWEPYTQTAMRIDPSEFGKDRTAYAIGSTLNGKIWLHEVVGLEQRNADDYNQNVKILCREAQKYRVQTIRIEKNRGGEAFAMNLRAAMQQYFLPESKELPRGWSCNIETTHSAGRKEQRIIASLSNVMAGHRLVVGRNVASNERVQNQITRMTNEPDSLTAWGGDDEIDAMAALVADLSGELELNPEIQAEHDRREYEQALIDAEIEAAHGPQPQQDFRLQPFRR